MAKPVKRNEHGQRIGDDHPLAVLTDHEVDVIRDLYELYGLPVGVLADKFGVHRNTVSRIVHYQARVSVVAEKRDQERREAAPAGQGIPVFLPSE